MSNNNGTTDASLFPSLLTVLFIGLKLTGHIDWSWWWILSPVWIMAIVAIFVIVAFIIYKIATSD